ncbi:MAG: hypothetical protein IJL87_05910 [Clostridia bacterium]|nr:hypothetical protein [Clostridia bacterium]
MKKIASGDRRLVITKNLIMMLVMLVVIFVAIFAWYSNNDTVTASGTQISAKSADNVQLALPKKVNGSYTFPINNNDWDTTISFNLSEYLENLVKDITSGGRQFVVPSFEAAKGLKDGRKAIVNDVWTDGLSTKEVLTNTGTLDDDQYNYISFDFYVRSKQESINVTSESFLAAGSELGIKDDGTVDKSGETITSKKSLNDPNPYRKSTYGGGTEKTPFSADALVGAIRVSLVGAQIESVNGSAETYRKITDGSYTSDTSWNDSSTLSFLWLPRPDVHLNTDNDPNMWDLTTGITTSDPLAEETYCHSFYEGNIITGNVKKGLKPHKYGDGAVKVIDGADNNVPSYFKVSDTRNDAHLGETGHYPTLGQSANITSGYENTNASSIQFDKGSGEKAAWAQDGYYVYKYTLNLWIEGEDAEARRSMNTGVFSLELDFGT